MMSQNQSYEELCAPAKKIVDKYYEEVVSFREIVTHDGFDEYGPESDIFDLYILSHVKDTYLVYRYGWENWFRGEIPKYKFISCHSVDAKDLNWVKEAFTENDIHFMNKINGLYKVLTRGRIPL